MTEDRFTAFAKALQKAEQQINLKRMERTTEVHAFLNAGLRPYTQAVFMATTLAVFAAERSGVSEVAPVHLLFGLLMPPNSIAVRLFEARGVSVHELRHELQITMGYRGRDWKQESNQESGIYMRASAETAILLPAAQALRSRMASPLLHTGHLLLAVLQLDATPETQSVWMAMRAGQLPEWEDVNGMEDEE
ncbi:MAG: hypothetical protein JWL77_1077 [Chthonomonadaceae bacterium]|nr:hypothetical protein [Chthonomonadaceae bacterium]